MAGDIKSIGKGLFDAIKRRITKKGGEALSDEIKKPGEKAKSDVDKFTKGFKGVF